MSPPISRQGPVLDTPLGHLERDLRRKGREINNDIADDRNCDCGRQVCAIALFNIFCYPCACTRIARQCAGIDPVRVKCLDECAIPGLELCSTSRPDCWVERGYGHNEYHSGQDMGSGFSRATLDKVNVVFGTVYLAIGTLCIAAYA